MRLLLKVAEMDVTVAQAESIQNLSGYDAGGSEFNITDNSAAVISATDSVLTDGHIHVDVTNTVGASDGAILNAFTADIDFTVSDDAADIAAEVMGSNGYGDLDDAEAVIVESGAAVDVDQAAAIQGISGYVGTMSDIDISDDAAALISAGDAVLNVTGVDTVTVNDGPVTAQEGALLAISTRMWSLM